MSWTLVDSCEDGQGIQARFFDITNVATFPGEGLVYTTEGEGQTLRQELQCVPGSTICYGAEPNPSDGQDWGFSLAPFVPFQVCKDLAPRFTCCQPPGPCCYLCDDVAIGPIHLTCAPE